jgi:hypothetical protein
MARGCRGHPGFEQDLLFVPVATGLPVHRGPRLPLAKPSSGGWSAPSEWRERQQLVTT